MSSHVQGLTVVDRGTVMKRRRRGDDHGVDFLGTVGGIIAKDG